MASPTASKDCASSTALTTVRLLKIELIHPQSFSCYSGRLPLPLAPRAPFSAASSTSDAATGPCATGAEPPGAGLELPAAELPGAGPELLAAGPEAAERAAVSTSLPSPEDRDARAAGGCLGRDGCGTAGGFQASAHILDHQCLHFPSWDKIASCILCSAPVNKSHAKAKEWSLSALRKKHNLPSRQSCAIIRKQVSIPAGAMTGAAGVDEPARMELPLARASVVMCPWEAGEKVEAVGWLEPPASTRCTITEGMSPLHGYSHTSLSHICTVVGSYICLSDIQNIKLSLIFAEVSLHVGRSACWWRPSWIWQPSQRCWRDRH